MKTILIFLVIVTTAFSQVLELQWKGAIGPVTEEYISRGVKAAEAKGCQLLVIKLDTPGGLLESTKEIVQIFYQSPVPIAVHVSPPGSRAASAGTFITAAAHWAAMNHDTHIGAAHPVQMGQKNDSSDIMNQKATEDATAFMKNIARKRNRDEEWLVSSIVSSQSITATEALELNVIDQITSTTDSIVLAINEGEFSFQGKPYKINEDARIIPYPLSVWLEILSLISNPNLAYILMLIGIYGLYFELSNPGAIFPGVIGAISLILALFSFHTLPINYAAAALIILGSILFFMELKIQSNGLLFIGGMIAMLFGSFMLIETDLPFLQISWQIIVFGLGLSFLFFALVIVFGLKAQNRKTKTGLEGMVGLRGKSVTQITSEKGKVFIRGEYWKAVPLNEDIEENQDIVVHDINELILIVKKGE